MQGMQTTYSGDFKRNDTRGFSVASALRNGYEKYSEMERSVAAGVWGMQLTVLEIALSDAVHHWVNRTAGLLDFYGMRRHNVKRRIKELECTASDMIAKCNAQDYTLFDGYLHSVWPSLVPSYFKEGGTITQQIQAAFTRQYSNDLNIIYFCVKNAADKANTPKSDLVASVSMVQLLSHTGVDAYNLIYQEIRKLTPAYKGGNLFEKTLGASNDLMRLIGMGNAVLPYKEGTDAVKLAEKFRSDLSGNGINSIVQSAIRSARMGFIECTIAYMRLALECRDVTISDWRTLLFRMGSKQNVRKLVKEIAAIPLPEKVPEDMTEMAEQLPDSVPGTALAEYRRLSLEDHVMIDKKETEEEKELRTLRRFVYRNEDGLDLPYLCWLYSRFGTKKAVTEYLLRAGDTMNRTLRKLKRIRCSELALNPDKGYSLRIGETIKGLKRERNISGKRLASVITRRELEVEMLERTNDFIKVTPDSLRPLLRALAAAFDVTEGYILFRSIQETGADNGTYPLLIRHVESVNRGK